MRKLNNQTPFIFFATVVLAMVIAFMFLNSHFFEIGSKRYTDLGNGWHVINVGRFEIETPIDFKYEKAQGIDSFVGRITNYHDTIEFDYGWYSNDLKDFRWHRRNVIINGRRAIMGFTEDDEVGVHFPDFGRKDNKLTLYARSEKKI